MKEYIEDLLEVLSQEDADKFLDTLKVVEKEAKDETAKEIFKDIDFLVDTLKRRYKKIPLNLEVFLIDYNEMKKAQAKKVKK